MQKNTSIRYNLNHQFFGLSKNICMAKYSSTPKVENLINEDCKNKPWFFIENV